MDTLLTSIFTNPMVAFVLLIGVVVFIHEAGHFLVGRLLGLSIEEFAIGFGPLAWSYTHKTTVYRINWLPLGGYVRFAPHPGNGAPREAYLNTAALHKRSLVSLAGPLFNFLLSVVIMVALSKVGLQEPATQVSVLPGSVAAQAGLQSGDTITAVNGQAVKSWAPFSKAISQAPGQPLQLQVDRMGTSLTVSLTPESHTTQSPLGETVAVGRIGVTPSLGGTRFSVPPESPLYQAGLRTGDVVVQVQGKPVTYGFEVSQTLAQIPSQSPVTLTVYRPAQPLDQVLPGGKTAPDQTAGSTLTLTFQNPQNLPALTGADVVISGWQKLKEGDRANLGIAQWQNCGLKKGHTVESLVGPGVAPSRPNTQVDVALWFEKLSQSLTQRATQAIDRLSTQPIALEVGVRDLGGQRATLACTIDAWVVYNHLNEANWVVALPAQFVANAGPLKTVLIQSPTWVQAVGDGWKAAVNQLTMVFEGVRKLVTGRISVANLGGPVSMAQVAGDAAQAGALGFLLTISLMSINVGLLNLLPLPGLDGGHLLLQAVEGAYGKPLPQRVQVAIQNVGLAIIFLLFVVVFYNDILRFIRR